MAPLPITPADAHTLLHHAALSLITHRDAAKGARRDAIRHGYTEQLPRHDDEIAETSRLLRLTQSHLAADGHGARAVQAADALEMAA